MSVDITIIHGNTDVTITSIHPSWFDVARWQANVDVPLLWHMPVKEYLEGKMRCITFSLPYHENPEDHIKIAERLAEEIYINIAHSIYRHTIAEKSKEQSL